jgi:hypothetical protein
MFLQNAKKEEKKGKQANEREKKPKKKPTMKEKKKEKKGHCYKVRAPTSPKKKFNQIFFNYKNACGSSFGPNLGLHYESRPMGFLVVSSKKSGTNRFSRLMPMVSNVNRP